MVLSRTPGLDPAALETALRATGPAPLGALPSLGQVSRDYLAGRRGVATAHELRWLEQPGHHLLPFTDPGYPAALGELPHKPLVLYVDGDPAVLSHPQLAIVGSRSPTPAGRETAFQFAQDLAGHGLAISSGLAEGIDSAAHRGALAAGGITLALLGCGVDVVYPPGNRQLSGQIRLDGALVSPFALQTPPRREHFPQRNNLIAALALGTLVVEAAKRSGSLITARFAGDHHRELFAVPGSIHNPLSRGCHELIRQGAKLTETTADILEELDPQRLLMHYNGAEKRSSGQAPPDPGMDKDRKILLDALGFDPTDPDLLVVRTGFKAQAVSSLLLILELEGHVQSAPGGRYSRVLRSRG
jgi:DNA processing protein